MTAGEVLDAAHSFPFRLCVTPSKIGRLLLSRPIPTMRASPAEA